MSLLQTTVQAAMRFACLIFAFLIASVAVQAQSLEVRLAGVPPVPTVYGAGFAKVAPLGAFKFEASGAPVQLESVVLTVAGTGDFANHLQPGDGLQLWLDNRDARFDMVHDTLLATADGAAPTTTLVLDTPLTIQPGEVIIWIAASFRAEVEAVDEGFTYSVQVADPADISAPGATVTLGTPPPVTDEISLKPLEPVESGPQCSALARPWRTALPWVLLAALAGLGVVRIGAGWRLQGKRDYTKGT